MFYFSLSTNNTLDASLFLTSISTLSIPRTFASVLFPRLTLQLLFFLRDKFSLISRHVMRASPTYVRLVFFFKCIERKATLYLFLFLLLIMSSVGGSNFSLFITIFLFGYLLWRESTCFYTNSSYCFHILLLNVQTCYMYNTLHLLFQ